MREHPKIRRFPAEWEPQAGLLLCWPHAHTAWAPRLKQVETVYLEFLREVTKEALDLQIILITPDKFFNDYLQHISTGYTLDFKRIHTYCLPSNDTWMRDVGPITVFTPKQILLLDYMFNGWGLKFAADLDNQLNTRLYQAQAFQQLLKGERVTLKTAPLVLEGGSIETDGAGTLLTTTRCLLSPNRNPHLNKANIERKLQKLLGIERILWLDHGYLAGDDTDSHIDTLARFAPNDTIVYMSCTDPNDEHYPELQAMAAELQALKTTSGKPYRLIPLPLPKPCYGPPSQKRLPASYANFMISNQHVFLPTYGDPANDLLAAERLSTAFNGYKIIPLACQTLIIQGGSLHCSIMQIPKLSL